MEKKQEKKEVTKLELEILELESKLAPTDPASTIASPGAEC